MTRIVPPLPEKPPVAIDVLACEPKQMRAYHDTWTPSAHSYLAYVRNRPIVARELRMDSDE
jgi:hypothetical protein